MHLQELFIFYMLLRKFSNCTYHVKIMLFNTYCSSMYCAQLWSNFNKGSIAKLRVAYNNAFRSLFSHVRDCSASNMFVSNRVNTFDSIWRKQIFRFRSRLEGSCNSLIRSLWRSDVFYSSLLHRHWCKLVY